jgi:hypothetical protein
MNQRTKRHVEESSTSGVKQNAAAPVKPIATAGALVRTRTTVYAEEALVMGGVGRGFPETWWSRSTARLTSSGFM